MQSTTTETGVRLRRGRGVLLALQWNAPFFLLFWFPWSTYQLAMAANCFLWALGCWLVGSVPAFRSLLFSPAPEAPPPRWAAAAVWMAALGTACLIISLLFQDQ